MNLLTTPIRNLTARQREVGLRLLIIAALQFVGVVLGWLVARNALDLRILMALSGLGLGAMVVYSIGRFEWGILGIIFAAGMLNGLTLRVQSSTFVPISLLLSSGLIGLWIVQLIVDRKQSPTKTLPLTRIIIAFALVNIIAAFWSNIARDPFVFVWDSFAFVQPIATYVNILLPAITLMIGYKISDEIWLKRMIFLFLAIGTAAILFKMADAGLFQWFRNGTFGIYSAWFGAIALGQALFNQKLPTWLRIMIGLVPGLWFITNGLEGTWWLSGWVPLLAATIAITFFKSRVFFAVTLLGGLFIVFWNAPQVYEEVIQQNINEGGLYRLTLIERSLSHVSNHPFLGMGPAGYTLYDRTYNPGIELATHNNYFDILGQTGIIGFTIFMGLIVTAATVCFRVRRQLIGRNDFSEGLINGILAGCGAALLGMMLGDWVLPYAYNQTILAFDNAVITWLMLGCGLVLYKLHIPEEVA